MPKSTTASAILHLEKERQRPKSSSASASSGGAVSQTPANSAINQKPHIAVGDTPQKNHESSAAPGAATTAATTAVHPRNRPTDRSVSSRSGPARLRRKIAAASAEEAALSKKNASVRPQGAPCTSTSEHTCTAPSTASTSSHRRARRQQQRRQAKPRRRPQSRERQTLHPQTTAQLRRPKAAQREHRQPSTQRPIPGRRQSGWRLGRDCEIGHATGTERNEPYRGSGERQGKLPQARHASAIAPRLPVRPLAPTHASHPIPCFACFPSCASRRRFRPENALALSPAPLTFVLPVQAPLARRAPALHSPRP